MATLNPKPSTVNPELAPECEQRAVVVHLEKECPFGAQQCGAASCTFMYMNTYTQVYIVSIYVCLYILYVCLYMHIYVCVH